ncbi:MAG: hypothetical protein AAGM38_13400 [Pseudomonadota bacterium]
MSGSAEAAQRVSSGARLRGPGRQGAAWRTRRAVAPLSISGRLLALEALGPERVGVSLALDAHGADIAGFLGVVAAREREARAAAQRRRAAELGPNRRAPAVRTQTLIDRETMILRLVGPAAALAPLRRPVREGAAHVSQDGAAATREARSAEEGAVGSAARRWDGARLRATLTLAPVILHAAGIAGLEARLLRLTPERPRPLAAPQPLGP